VKTIEVTATVTADHTLTVHVQVPDEVAPGAHRVVLVMEEAPQVPTAPAPETTEAELRLLAAVKLYELGRCSSGAAARLAGVSRPLFLAKLGEYGVPTFRLTEDELRDDLAHA
jgi:predicted HTH domain antitoxin